MVLVSLDWRRPGFFCISLRFIINPPSVFSVPDSKNHFSEVSIMALAISLSENPRCENIKPTKWG
jgi:hypothetical protein